MQKHKNLETLDNQSSEKSDLLSQLSRRRERLIEKLKSIARSQSNAANNVQDWFEELLQFCINIFIQLLNAVLSVFGIQIPTLGPSEERTPLEDTLRDNQLNNDYIEPKCSFEKRGKSRPLAIKNYLRRAALNLPSSDQILRNISEQDLKVLQTLTNKQADSVMDAELNEVNRMIRDLSVENPISDDDCLIDDFDTESRLAPKLMC